jgi:hypothetical protein
MNAGEIVTLIVGLVVAVATIAVIWDARRKRRQAAASQTHSNVKPLATHDRADLIQSGGLGDQGIR